MVLRVQLQGTLLRALGTWYMVSVVRGTSLPGFKSTGYIVLRVLDT